jgi:hypothetical protein
MQYRSYTLMLKLNDLVLYNISHREPTSYSCYAQPQVLTILACIPSFIIRDKKTDFIKFVCN